MLYLPKFSVGSKVAIDGDKTGVIDGISTNLTYRKKDGKLVQEEKTYYFVKLTDGNVKKVPEKHLRDADTDTDEEKDDSKLDEFLADLLLLSRKLDPERVDNTLNVLLKKGDGVDE